MKEQNVMIINGLMWQKETVEKKMNWYEAIEYVKKLNLDGYAGYYDWRLPSQNELIKVVKVCGGKSVKHTDENWSVFMHHNLNNLSYQDTYKKKRFSANYHHSSTYNGSFAYGIDFESAEILHQDKTHNGHIRCVRDKH